VEDNATDHVSVLFRRNAITHHTPLIEVCNLNAINFSFKVLKSRATGNRRESE